MNPGVITLVSRKIFSSPNLRPNSLVIEDNIGEAIHIHYRNLRFDLTINEFFNLSHIFEEAVKNLALYFKIPINAVDPSFLINISPFFGWIDKVVECQINIDQLLAIEYTPEKRRFVPVGESLAYKYLSNSDEGYIEYTKQFNKHEYSPVKLCRLCDSIAEVGYPKDAKIITFGDEPFIRDGMHRAACLLFLGMKNNVPILNFRFKSKAPKNWMINPH